jgi:large subunit ribosomal protein L18
MALTKRERRLRIKNRIRSRIAGTADRPRMSVFRSNKEIYVQFIDDDSGKTIISISSRDKGVEGKKTENKIEIAGHVGKAAAGKAIEKGISSVVFDRNGYLFHGRVKALADAAREGGLKF